jgi:hypothetical protein
MPRFFQLGNRVNKFEIGRSLMEWREQKHNAHARWSCKAKEQAKKQHTQASGGGASGVQTQQEGISNEVKNGQQKRRRMTNTPTMQRCTDAGRGEKIERKSERREGARRKRWNEGERERE